MKYRKHHYVPEFYLRFFSVIHAGDRNPMLWVYDKEQSNPRKQSPKDTAAINDLYRVSKPGMASNAVEIAFSKLENAVSPILTRWQSPRAVPTIDEIVEGAYFLALLHLRNPKMAKFVEAVADVVAGEKIKAIARDDTRFDQFWQWYLEKESGPPPIGKEEYRKLALEVDQRFVLQVDPEHATLSPLAHADAICQELKKMYWCLCSAPKDTDFITSDSPLVVRFRKESGGLAFGGGFGHQAAQVTFPLSPRACLYLSRTCRWKALSVSSTFVKNANRRTVINAERYVFASQRSSGIEKLVKKYAGTRHHPRIDKQEVIEDMRRRAIQRQSALSGPQPS